MAGESAARARLIGGAVFLAIVVGVVWLRRQPDPGTPAVHQDERVTHAYRKAMEAPEGATPCETGWNALSAVQNAAIQDGLPPPYATMPTREAFLEVCGALSADDQRCLVPKYQMANTKTCDPLLMSLWQPSDGGKKTFGDIMPHAQALPAAPIASGAAAPAASPH